MIGDPGDEGCFGADDDEVDVVLAAEPEQAFHVIHADGMAAGERPDAGVPRCCVELLERVARGDLPGERVLTTAGPHHQDLHASESRRPAGCLKERRNEV